MVIRILEWYPEARKLGLGQVGVADIQPMSIWQIILAVVLAVLSMLAIGAVAFALFYGGRLDIALVGGVVLLAFAQLLSLFARAGGKRESFGNIKDLMTANDTLSQEQALLRRRLDRVEAAMAAGHTAASEQLDAQVRALEHSVSALARHNQPKPAPAPASATAPATAPPSAPAPASPPAASNRMEPVFDSGQPPRELDVYLEPIVHLPENRTAYYRASLAVRRGEGEAVPVASIAREAERAGFLGELDMTIFERVTPVIRRLLHKGRMTAVFCPVSAPSFADENFMRNLLDMLDQNRDIASSLVIEITHGALSQLSDRGQEGLAHLAQMGATFSLSNLRSDFPDFATLRDLGFMFVSADVSLLIALKNESQQSTNSIFAQASRNNLHLIAANVSKQSELAWIEGAVPLAYGSQFAPPRLVRHDITDQHEQAQVA